MISSLLAAVLAFSAVTADCETATVTNTSDGALEYRAQVYEGTIVETLEPGESFGISGDPGQPWAIWYYQPHDPAAHPEAIASGVFCEPAQTETTATPRTKPELIAPPEAAFESAFVYPI